jgi:hypothetical protein
LYFSPVANGDDSIKTLEARIVELEEMVRKWVSNRKRDKIPGCWNSYMWGLIFCSSSYMWGLIFYCMWKTVLYDHIISLSNIRPIIIYFHSSQCRLIPYLHQRPIFFKANSICSSIVAIRSFSVYKYENPSSATFNNCAWIIFSQNTSKLAGYLFIKAFV